MNALRNPSAPQMLCVTPKNQRIILLFHKKKQEESDKPSRFSS